MTRRKWAAAALTAMLCALVCAVCLIAAACGDPVWDISADKDSDVKAELVTRGGGCTLRVSGHGEMKDWASPDEVPWKDKADRIDRIEIAEGVRSVGANAFFATRVRSVLLPQSVVRAGSGFIAADAEIFAYSDAIEYGGEFANVLLYRETPPETKDRFWQQDKTKGDIFSDPAELLPAEGGYWRFVGTNAVKWEATKVLFVGNSFTYRNGAVEYSSGVPGIFDRIAEDLGYCVETYAVTGPGWYLKNHAKGTDACGKQIEKLLNAVDDFDFVILQEHSLNPIQNYDDFLGGVRAMQEKIEATQTHARIVLYETWGSPTSARDLKTTVPEMEEALRTAYENAAAACGGLTVSYVGKAFTDVYLHEDSIYLWDTDNRHQGYTGAYLSACVHVGTILGGDVRNTAFEGEAQYHAPTLPAETYAALRNSAYNIVFGGESEA